jgi:protein-tyrosine phosphatase
MVDLHCHILPGLDDGAKTIEDSLAMAEDAIADGITHVVATPHANSHYVFEFSRVRAARKELSERLEGRLTLGTGCDFHLSPENLKAIRIESAPFCINQKDYLLVELNDFSIPPAMDQALHELQLAGLHPIITHPERNGLLRAQPERLRKWVELGCYAQVIAEQFDEGRARALLLENPLAAFEGRPLPHVPERAPIPAPRKRKRFLFF